MKGLFLGIAIGALPPASAVAGDIADRAKAAEQALDAGNAVGAWTMFEGVADSFWNALPLTVQKAVIVESATGYGIYTIRDSDSFAPGSSMIVYIEPVGYGYGKDPLGNVAIALDVDLRMLGQDGQEVAVVEDIASVDLVSRTRNREMFFKLTLNLEASVLPPGSYRAMFTLRDRNSPKRATFPVDFTIAG